MTTQTIREHGEDMILAAAMLIRATDYYTKHPYTLYLDDAERECAKIIAMALDTLTQIGREKEAQAKPEQEASC